MGANRFAWINRVFGHGGKQAQRKKSNKWARKTYFAIHAHNEKKQEVCRDGHGGQRGSFGGMEGKEEARGAIWMCVSN